MFSPQIVITNTIVILNTPFVVITRLDRAIQVARPYTLGFIPFIFSVIASLSADKRANPGNNLLNWFATPMWGCWSPSSINRLQGRLAMTFPVEWQ